MAFMEVLYSTIRTQKLGGPCGADGVVCLEAELQFTVPQVGLEFGVIVVSRLLFIFILLT